MILRYRDLTALLWGIWVYPGFISSALDFLRFNRCMNDELEDMPKNSVRDVFRKMPKAEPTAIPTNNHAIHGGTHIATTTGFIGDIAGLTYARIGGS